MPKTRLKEKKVFFKGIFIIFQGHFLKRGVFMNDHELLLFPCSSASDFFKKYRRRLSAKKLSTWLRRGFVAVLTAYFLAGFSSPTAQTSVVDHIQADLQSLARNFVSRDELITDEIITLGQVIQYATDWRLSEREALRFAGLIYHASQLYGQDPLEIVALIAAESSFDYASINEKSGDFGLGQVNWKYWGSSNGLTPRDLLDPATNLVMTCKILDHYGGDFSKYHGGNGIKSKAYEVNVKSILSSLKAYVGSLHVEGPTLEIKSS
jgi:hypothetical protein